MTPVERGFIRQDFPPPEPGPPAPLRGDRGNSMPTLSERVRPEPVAPPNLQRATKWCREHGISIQTFHRWRFRPEGPPAHKLFGLWYVDPNEMDEWITSRSNRGPAAPQASPVTSARRRAE